MKRESGIYLILCRPTGEKYVGSACNFSRRIREHKYDLRHGNHHNYKLLSSWVKNGEDNFEFSVLETVPDKGMLIEREQFWFDTLKPELNISKFAEHPGQGVKRSTENKKRASDRQRKWHSSLTDEQREDLKQKIKDGVQEFWESLDEVDRINHIKKISNPCSEETKKILSFMTKQAYAAGKLSRVRKPHSKEAIHKIKVARAKQAKKQLAETARKRAIWEVGREQREIERREKISQGNKGKVVSEETKEKIRQAANAQWLNPDYKRKHHKALKKVMSSPEMAEKLSKAHKGKKLTKDHIAKITASNVGKKRSEASCKRLSESRKRWWAKRKAK